ncbi:hypothetical protein [Desulfogranum mediterraneum]|uniref:hypothetical protein n=1 Tax=Desulfogranum mediterraneum TaxID=160661 RepID=UPI001ABFB799|nr:hypothetical protein [Desulfogranum mediterraneum]
MVKLLFVLIDGLRSEALECAHVCCLHGFRRKGVSAELAPFPLWQGGIVREIFAPGQAKQSQGQAA